jgi:hypothetical protein
MHLRDEHWHHASPGRFRSLETTLRVAKFCPNRAVLEQEAKILHDLVHKFVAAQANVAVGIEG